MGEKMQFSMTFGRKKSNEWKNNQSQKIGELKEKSNRVEKNSYRY